MRKVIFGLVSVLLTGVAAPAFAQSAIGSLQINVQPVQTAQTNALGLLAVGGKLDVSTQAVGNNLSIETNDFSLSVGAQINDQNFQTSETNVLANLSADNASFNTIAVGNNASIEVPNAGGPEIALNLSGQDNNIDFQRAETNLGLTLSGGKVDVATTAVGNALSIEANNFVGNLSGQENFNFQQVAQTNIGLLGGTGKVDISTTAVGNLANLTGDAAIAGLSQVNLQGVQLAQTNILGAGSLSGNLNISTAAVGNSISVSIPNP